MNNIALLLLVSTAMLIGTPAGADTCTLGSLRLVTGEVQVVRGALSAPATKGSGICEQDRYVTGEHGVATLHFRDGTEIVVGKTSDFMVRRWREHRVLRANQAQFELFKGAFRAITGAFTQRAHRMEIRTAIATVGIRGTDFWGGIGLTPGGLDVVMLNGKGVYVKNDAGRTELSVPGTGTTVMPGQAPSAAKKWPDEKVQRAVQTITP